jgi:hypothetical protein
MEKKDSEGEAAKMNFKFSQLLEQMFKPQRPTFIGQLNNAWIQMREERRSKNSKYFTAWFHFFFLRGKFSIGTWHSNF